MEHIVDLLLEEINAQRQFLIERKKMLTDSDRLGGSFRKISNSLKEIGLSRNMENEITHHSRFQKNKVQPIILNSPQDHSSFQASHYMDNYYATKSPSTTYENIIALYKSKSKSFRPRSANSKKIAVAVYENPIQPSNAHTANTEKVKRSSFKGDHTPKKPAFCIRKSDALYHFPPASKSTGGTPSVTVADEGNKMDANLEIFANIMSKQHGSAVAINPNGNNATAAETLATQKALKFPVGAKKTSSLPSYVSQFPPAPSVPFLPSKSKRIMRLDCNGDMDPPDAVVHSSEEPLMVAETTNKSNSMEWFKEVPYRSKRMDVIVTVEHCCDCDDHMQSTRHDAKRYVERANDVLYSVIDLISSGAMVDPAAAAAGEDENVFPVRLFCMRMKRSSPDRLGAFEVTVAVNVTPSLEQTGYAKRGGSSISRREGTKQSTTAIMEEESDPVGDSVWATHLVYSKLQTKCWPSAGAVQTKVKQFLLAVLSDERKKQQALDTLARRRAMLGQGSNNNESSGSSHHKRSSVVLSDVDSRTAKINAVDESYLRWVDRMRIPPKVERHPLDFDWPTLEERILKKKAPPFTAAAAAAAERVVTCVEVKLPHEHPRGPYIDLGLAEHMSRDAFEESVLKHFEVVDMTT